jgi:hypothetical protein
VDDLDASIAAKLAKLDALERSSSEDEARFENEVKKESVVINMWGLCCNQYMGSLTYSFHFYLYVG